jgi:hypothetical protein
MSLLDKYRALKIGKPNHVSYCIDELKRMGFTLTHGQLMRCVRMVGTDRILQEARLVHSNFKDYRSQINNPTAVLYARITKK